MDPKRQRQLELEAEAEAEAELELEQEEQGKAQAPALDLKDSENSPLYAKLASGFMGGLSSLGDLADLGIQGAQSAGRLLSFGNTGRTLGDLNRDSINNIPTNIGGAARSAIDAATNLPDSTQIDPDSWAYRIGSYAPGVLAGPGSLAQKAGLDVLMSGAGTAGNEVAGPYGELAATLLTPAILSKGAKLASSALQNKSLSKYQEMLGYNPSKTQTLSTGIDAEGGLTQKAKDAVDFASRKDLDLQNLMGSGFKEKLGALDNPKDVFKALWEHQQEAGQNIGNIIDDLAAKEGTLLTASKSKDGLKGVALKSMFGKKAAQAAGEATASTSPTFSNAQSLVDDISAVNEKEGAKLASILDDIKNKWEKSPQDLKTLKGFQEKWGILKSKSFSPKASAAESLADDLNKAVYGDLAGSLQNRVSALDPELGKAFKEANKQYASTTSFKNSTFNASRQSKLEDDLFGLNPFKGQYGLLKTLGVAAPAAGVSPLVGLLLGADRAATIVGDKLPVLTAKFQSGLGGAAGNLSNATSLKNSLSGNLEPLIQALQNNDQ